MPYLGDILIDVIEDEDLDESSSTTDHALEDGEQITDHIENNPIVLNISGVIIDPSDEKLLKLREYRQKGEILNYNYRSRLETVLITSFKPKKNKDIKDGYTFTMTLKQVRMAKAPNVIRVSVPVKKQVKAVTKAGKKTVRKSVNKTPVKKVTSKPKTKTPSGGLGSNADRVMI
ncbi:phage baseplate protein [Sporosarcina contaminans]|uniref:Phage baseplate protein n=1 Tax=Sporosarcina contaminans TaxID=633403 RepID=A0ABW3U3G5_9BACL